MPEKTRSMHINETLEQYNNFVTHISFLQKSFSNASKRDKLEVVRKKKKLPNKTKQCRKDQKDLKKKQTASSTGRLVTFICTMTYKSFSQLNY